MKDLLQRVFGSPKPAQADRNSVHSMLSQAERDHLFELARDRYTGAGAILDLGTWLGGSTAALAAGMQANSREQARKGKVHAFDRFEMNQYLKTNYPYPELKDIPVGGSFLPVFQQNLAPWAANVDVHPGDLNAFTWKEGPVELAHVDIMKTWALANAVLRMFFKELIPGATILHQDFVHYNTVWIHLLMHRLRDHFEPIGQVPGSTTFEFRLRTVIPPALLDHTYGFGDFDAAEEKAAFAWSRSLVQDPFMRFNIDAAEAMTHLHKGDRSTTEAVLAPALAAEAAYKTANPQEKRRSELHKVKERLSAA